MRQFTVLVALALGVTLPSVALAIAMIGGLAGFYALYRTFGLARDLNAALTDQHVGIRVVSEAAMSLADEPPIET